MGVPALHSCGRYNNKYCPSGCGLQVLIALKLGRLVLLPFSGLCSGSRMIAPGFHTTACQRHGRDSGVESHRAMGFNPRFTAPLRQALERSNCQERCNSVCLMVYIIFDKLERPDGPRFSKHHSVASGVSPVNAKHRHARGLLLHATKLCMTELSHASAARPQRPQNSTNSVCRYRVSERNSRKGSLRLAA